MTVLHGCCSCLQRLVHGLVTAPTDWNRTARCRQKRNKKQTHDQSEPPCSNRLSSFGNWQHSHELHNLMQHCPKLAVRFRLIKKGNTLKIDFASTKHCLRASLCTAAVICSSKLLGAVFGWWWALPAESIIRQHLWQSVALQLAID